MIATMINRLHLCTLMYKALYNLLFTHPFAHTCMVVSCQGAHMPICCNMWFSVFLKDTSYMWTEGAGDEITNPMVG